MIKPIFLYGHSVLRKKNVSVNFEKVSDIITNLFDTMDKSEGIGLAAPQIGVNKRMFVVDTELIVKNTQEKSFRGAFINPEIIQIQGDVFSYKEGCLSIPGIQEEIKRKSEVTAKYINEKGEMKQGNFKGMLARVFLHEFDHLEGILIVDKLSILRKQLLGRKLKDITKGKVDVSYPFSYAK